jgi:hypothetical protein
MLGPIPQLIHNKFVANSVLLAICYELATIGVVANPRFSCSVWWIVDRNRNYFLSLQGRHEYDLVVEIDEVENEMIRKLEV